MRWAQVLRVAGVETELFQDGQCRLVVYVTGAIVAAQPADA